MLEKIRTIIKQKGQGMVEYALLLAFIVGIGMMMNGSNLGGSVKGVFDDVANVLLGPEYDLNTPEGRLAADKARIKKLGESLAAHFKKKNVKDDYPKDNPVDLNGEYISILVLSDGSVNIFTGTGQNGKWLTELNNNNANDKATYDKYISALKDAGIDLKDPYVSQSSVTYYNPDTKKTIDMGKTQYYTDTNLKPYSSGDENGLNNGYAISFTKIDGKMQLKYYELNNPYTKEDLGTRYVPRSWLRNGESNGAVSEEAKAGKNYDKTPTVELSVD